MTWLRLIIDSSAELAPACEDALLELGAAAVTLEDNADQPLFAQADEDITLWRETRVTGLFHASARADALWQEMPASLQESCHHRAEILEDIDWERDWMQHYQPIAYGDRFWVCPSWLEPPDPNAINLRLDPGLAFGTGTHPTTAMCLRLLGGMTLTDKQMVDYGCGSGILAIAALLLGCRRAIGVDTDRQAIVASTSNASLNNITPAQLALYLPADAPAPEPVELVVANILAGPLAELAPVLMQLLDRGGTLLLSGILEEQAAELIVAYQPWLPLDIACQQEGWVALRGVRP
jgi:ribosomal protein L11 methyltransferase